MRRQVYVITEGVHDVAYLSRLLGKCFALRQAEALSDLSPVFRHWIESSCKWPHRDRIDRSSVPAPEIYVKNDLEVALTNAEGIDRIRTKLKVDLEYFARTGASLDALGVILDADDADPMARKQEMVAGLNAELEEAALLPQPRTDVFVLPDDRSSGTLEDVLIPVGTRLYPALFASAATHIQLVQNGLHDLLSSERKAFARPSGPRKALLSAVAAVLKPGKAIQATLKDHRWVSQDTLAAPELAPTIAFLQRLLHDGSHSQDEPETETGQRPRPP